MGANFFVRKKNVTDLNNALMEVTKLIALSVTNYRTLLPNQIALANVPMVNVWTIVINSAMAFQIVTMEVMNFDAWIADMEFLTTWDVMGNLIALMSRTNVFAQ